MIKRALNGLFGRLALVIFAGFILVGVFAVFLFMQSSKAKQNEIAQTLHRNLAQHVIDENTILINGQLNKAALKTVFMKLMVLGPNFELYLLDPTGKVVAHSTDPGNIKQHYVDLDPIEQFILDSSEQRTLYGTDPRSEYREKIFSVAPVIEQGVTKGFLYVIIGGEAYDDVAQLVHNSVIYQWMFWALLGGLMAALLVTLAAVRVVMGPLCLLTNDVKHFRQQGLNSSEALEFNYWDSASTNEIDQLGTAFRSMAEQLIAQYKEVKNIDDLRRELMSHVSHDLRTPLASLLGYLETWQMKQGEISDKQSREFIATAHKNAKKIDQLVEQLFELAHLDSGNVQLHYEAVPLAELVQDVLQKFSLEAEEHGVHLDVSPKDPSLVVMADIEKLDRVFSNLISNAIRHCSPSDNVIVNLVNETRGVLVQVKDSGIGIPASDLPHIFNAHYKAANSVRGNTAHGGLGLAITKKLLALHNTTISVSSVESQGTEFNFLLEAAVA